MKTSISWGVAIAVSAGCSHEVSGAGLLLNLNVQPPPPSFAGALDFDLQPATNYTACVKRDRGFSTNSVQHWIMGSHRA
jgi:hypothetical protein